MNILLTLHTPLPWASYATLHAALLPLVLLHVLLQYAYYRQSNKPIMAADLCRTHTAPEDRPRLPSRPSLRRARSTPDEDVYQSFSSQFMDDHGAHHYHVPSRRPEDTIDDNDAEMEPPGSPMSDDTIVENSPRESQETEVHFGILNSHDLETGPTRPELKSEKPATSTKDPNLVSRVPFTRCQVLAINENSPPGHVGWRR